MLKKEAFIPDLMKQVANTQDVDGLIDELLDYIGKGTGADRTYIFELNNESGNWDNTHEWCKKGIEPQINNLQDVDAEVIGVWLREFKKSNLVIIHDIEAYKAECRKMYDILKPQDIHSLVVSPLEIQGKYIGFFGVDNPPQKGIEAISAILLELQYLLVIMLRYRNMNLELSRMSFEDQLTGAKNRHALRSDGLKLDANGSIGFVLCDINGLKEANDTLGHESGDKLIIDTAEAMREVFGNRYVYRLGGDEFVAFLQYCSESEFLARHEQLLAAFQAKGVRVATGHVFSPKADAEITHYFKMADELMYDDKRKFYESGTGGDRRKARR